MTPNFQVPAVFFQVTEEEVLFLRVLCVCGCFAGLLFCVVCVFVVCVVCV